ncbi:MAG: hypothetical protein ACJA06_001047 [Halocynthiibacter sp.]|jgi:hypothetical protein
MAWPEGDVLSARRVLGFCRAMASAGGDLREGGAIGKLLMKVMRAGEIAAGEGAFGGGGAGEIGSNWADCKIAKSPQ